MAINCTTKQRGNIGSTEINSRMWGESENEVRGWQRQESLTTTNLCQKSYVSSNTRIAVFGRMERTRRFEEEGTSRESPTMTTSISFSPYMQEG